jgi:hypothetical protein
MAELRSIQVVDSTQAEELGLADPAAVILSQALADSADSVALKEQEVSRVAALHRTSTSKIYSARLQVVEEEEEGQGETRLKRR